MDLGIIIFCENVYFLVKLHGNIEFLLFFIYFSVCIYQISKKYPLENIYQLDHTDKLLKKGVFTYLKMLTISEVLQNKITLSITTILFYRKIVSTNFW